jgi:hypothetical protein
MVNYVRGKFIGGVDDLAAADQQYPMLIWERRIASYAARPDGLADLTLNNNWSVSCAPGVSFEPKAWAIWGPDNDPVPPADDTAGKQ